MIDTNGTKIELTRKLQKRKEELEFLEIYLESLNDVNKEDTYRKSLTVMLYSHFEGFFKEALNDFYVDLINAEEIPFHRASIHIQTCSSLQVFKDLQNITNKSGIFKKVLPEDSQLHYFHRRIEFVEKFSSLFLIGSNEQIINIPTSTQEISQQKKQKTQSLVDTGSNLKVSVFRKILFQLDFDYDSFKSREHNIKDLVDARNEIAHGTFSRGIDSGKYQRLRENVFEILDAIVEMIVEALENKEYLKLEFR
ncbi:MAG: hypothetical protein ACJAWV_000337 [Flammeovirgaceae bacterium]|jgi:hypothetical protein